MKFMMLVKADKDHEAGLPPNPAVLADMRPFMAGKMESGAVLEIGGLMPSKEGALLSAEGGALTVVDGPFTESKELIAGYAIIEADSREAAIALTREFMEIHLRTLGASYTGICEVRRMFEPANPDAGCGSV